MPPSTLRVPEITQPLSTGLFIGWGMSGVLEGHLSKVDTAHSRNWADQVPYIGVFEVHDMGYYFQGRASTNDAQKGNRVIISFLPLAGQGRLHLIW